MIDTAAFLGSYRFNKVLQKIGLSGSFPIDLF